MPEPASRSERLAEFFRRLLAAPAASSADEAFEQLARTLDEVEDEMTAIPRDPGRWRTDGRLYPPQRDAARDVPGRPEVTRYRSKGHNVYIGANGSIEIQVVGGEILLSKAGADGREVGEL